MRISLTLLLQVAGVLHLGLMSAGLLMPRAVNMRAHLAGLPAFIRQLFWVYYTFIGFCLVSFSIITIAFAETLASGNPGARLVRLLRRLLDAAAAGRDVRLRHAAVLDEHCPKRWLSCAERRLCVYLPIVYALCGEPARIRRQFLITKRMRSSSVYTEMTIHTIHTSHPKLTRIHIVVASVWLVQWPAATSCSEDRRDTWPSCSPYPA